MVDMVIMYQQQSQQQCQQQLKCRIKSHKHEQTEQKKERDFYYTFNTYKKCTRTNTTAYLRCMAETIIKSCCRCVAFKYNRYYCCSSKGLCLWRVLVVFMLILCSNIAISQQRNINNNFKHNNNNDSTITNNNSNNNKSNSIDNILLQISKTPTPPTPPPPSPPQSSLSNPNNSKRDNIRGVGIAGVFDGGVGIIVADEVEAQVFDEALKNQQLKQTAKSNITTKSIVSTTSTSLPSAKNASRFSIGNTNTNTNNTFNFKSNYSVSLLNDGESIIATISNNKKNSDNNNKSKDLINSVEIFNESEDGYEHSSTVSSTTQRPHRPPMAPQLSSVQERERRLMNVLAARRSALQRPGFRNRIGTTGRTATAVETTSKSPTDPRSICIRNCTKNFTRRTTASCMRQCANFSRVASGGSSTLLVKNSSKSGSGTAQAGERDTNEILFTDESSHGLLVIAKEQNDTLNHIPDENKGGTVAKLRGRRKQQTQVGTVTLATTSIEDDDIQPYLYFGQKLPPLKPNALTITSVSDEHPKLLEVSVADAEASSTTPASSTSASTLSAVERSRARFKYNMRNGVSFNRRYTTINRSTTPEVPVELRTTTLRIVADMVKEPKVKVTLFKPEFLDKVRDTSTSKTFTENTNDKWTMSSSTPLIITVLSDEDIVTPTPDSEVINNKNEEHMQRVTALPTTTARETSTSTTTITTTTAATTNTTTTTNTSTSTTKTNTSTTTKRPTSPLATTSTRAANATNSSTVPTVSTSTASTSTPTTTTTQNPQVYQQPLSTPLVRTTTITSPSTTLVPPLTPATQIITKRPIMSDEDTELLRKLGPSLTQPISMDDKTNLIIFVNRTIDTYRPNYFPSTTTIKPQRAIPPYIPQAATTDSSTTILHTTILTSIRSTVNTRSKDIESYNTTPLPTASSQKGPVLTNEMTSSSTTLQPVITGEISSTVVTNDQEISVEMQRMNIVTMVLAGIGIVPLLAIILYLLRNYLLKRPIKDDEDFDVCITDQQPISPVKKIETNFQEEDEDEVDHHKKPPQRQHSLHNKLMSPPLARDNNHNLALNQQRFDDKSSVSSDQEFDRSNIRLKSLLGEGNFGQVWKAEADDLSGHFGATRIVAVKTIKACSTQLSLKDEANIMRKLGSHQNVVTLLGACVDSEPHMLIMEYAMRGRLLSLLRAARNATNILPVSVPGGRSLAPLSPRTLAGFCLDIACGMEYIAEKRIVHRDLAARNVLLDHNGVCKICDFGMSIDLDAERKRKEMEKNCANEIMRSNFNKFKFDFGEKFLKNHWVPNPTKDSSEKKTHGHDTIGKRPALPIRWMAPEALQYNLFSSETDIWAFGIVLWEIATLGSTPYSQINGREVIRRVPLGLRPDLPKEGRHEFYNLMSRCWHKDPHMRPSFSQCRLEISRSLHKWVDDDSTASDYMDVSGFSEDLEQGMVYFNHRISEFECEI